MIEWLLLLSFEGINDGASATYSTFKKSFWIPLRLPTATIIALLPDVTILDPITAVQGAQPFLDLWKTIFPWAEEEEWFGGARYLYCAVYFYI